MSAIGDWIYLYSENYARAYSKSDINSSFVEARSRMADQLNKVKKRREGIDIKSLETRYNNIRAYFGGTADLDPSFNQKVVDAIKATLNERFEEAYDDKKVNQATARVTGRFDGDEAIISARDVPKSTAGTYVSTFVRRVAALKRDYDQINSNKSQCPQKYLDFLSTSITNIESRLKDLVRSIEIKGVDNKDKNFSSEDYLKSVLDEACGDVIKNIGFISKNPTKGDYSAVTSLKADINKLLVIIKGSGLAGAAGQYLEEESALILEYLITGQLKEGMKNFKTSVGAMGDSGISTVVGSTGTSSVGYKFADSDGNNNFIKGFDKYLSDMGSFISKNYKENDFQITKKVVKDKVDVSITQNENGEEAIRNFSVKNYNPESIYDIHLVSSTPLLYLLQNENENNFVNHYLNIVLPHYHKNDKRSPVDETPTVRNTYDLYDTAINIVKQMVLVKALTGIGTLNEEGSRPVADYFLVNDNSTGKVHIYAVDELIADAIEHQLFFYKTKVKNGKKMETTDFTGLNRFVKSDSGKFYSGRAGVTRIYQVLGALHRQKVEASIDIRPRLKET